MQPGMRLMPLQSSKHFFRRSRGSDGVLKYPSTFFVFFASTSIFVFIYKFPPSSSLVSGKTQERVNEGQSKRRPRIDEADTARDAISVSRKR